MSARRRELFMVAHRRNHCEASNINKKTESTSYRDLLLSLALP
jgi:hypothetical protein